MEEERRIEIYQGAEGEVVFDVDAEGETIWATQAQMAQLFGVAPQTDSPCESENHRLSGADFRYLSDLPGFQNHKGTRPVARA